MFIYSTTNVLNINFKYSRGCEYCDMNREKIIKLEYIKKVINLIMYSDTKDRFELSRENNF